MSFFYFFKLRASRKFGRDIQELQKEMELLVSNEKQDDFDIGTSRPLRGHLDDVGKGVKSWTMPRRSRGRRMPVTNDDFDCIDHGCDFGDIF